MGCRVGASLKEFMLIVLEHVISASMFLNLSLMIAVFPVPVATHARYLREDTQERSCSPKPAEFP